MTTSRCAAVRSTSLQAATALLSLVILALGTVDAAEVPDTPFAGRPLIEALERLEQGGLTIVYSSALVRPDMVVTAEPGRGDPRSTLEQLLQPFGLGVREGPGGLLVVVARASGPIGTGLIKGIVVAAGRQGPPEGVTVRVDGTALQTTVSSDGSFAIAGVPPGEQTVEALSPGFLPQSIEGVRVRAGAVAQLRFELKPASVFLDEVVVTPSHFRILDDRPESRQILSRDEVAQMPHLADDLLHAVKRLPGAAGADVSAQLNLRGGLVDEVLVILDGLELYEPFHLKDFQSVFSTIDAEAAGGVDFLTGGFPVEYGDRMSGVLDISTAPSSGSATTAVGLGTLNARLLSQGTFDASSGQWLVSGRGWYPALLVDASGAVNEEIVADYYDLLARVEHPVGGRSNLSADALVAYDDLGFLSEDEESVEDVEARYQSYHLWFNLRTEWTTKLHSQTILSGGEVRRKRVGALDDVEDGTLDVDDHRTLNFAGLKQDWTLTLDDHHLLKWGMDVRSQQAEYEYSRRSVGPGPEGRAVVEDTMVDFAPSGVSLGCYLADRFRLGEALVAELGLRWDAQRWLDEEEISPRVNLYWSPGAETTVRASWGLFYQSQRLNEVEVEDGVSELAGAQRAKHTVLSVEHRMASGLVVRLEGYHKELDHLRPRHENLFNPIDLFPEARSDRVLISPDGGRAQGLELLVKWDQGRPLSWWLGYAVGRAEDEVDGEMVPRSWDQRHAATLGLNLALPRGWNVNLGGTYHSGWPTTAVTGEVAGYDDDGEPVVELVVGPRNRERLPEYYRLDLRASKRWAPTRFGQLSLVLEVVNLTNHRNVCCYDDLEGVVTEDGEVEVLHKEMYWAPIVPSLGVRWQY